MWYIKYNDNEDKQRYIELLFRTKMDAFKYIQANSYKKSLLNICVESGDTNLLNDSISVGTLLRVKTETGLIDYGVIQDISNHLVTIEKNNGDLTEITKSRINKELISGTFKLKR